MFIEDLNIEHCELAIKIQNRFLELLNEIKK